MKHVYLIRATGELLALDVPARVLALMSRGRVPLTGALGRPEREELAELLDGTALAAALLSGRPLLVDGDAAGGGWTFREV